jgi:phosphatidate phosphatase PAH1
MRHPITLLASVLCSSCGQLALAPIPDATPKHASAVVFDIDGTLTPHQLSIFDARIDAANAVQTFAKKGYKIIYLSTRTRRLQAGIPVWLKKEGFPVESKNGNIYVAQTDDDLLYYDEFKARILKKFKDKGWTIEFAYGDSHTDFVAYALAQIPKERVFALQPMGETSCEQRDLKEYRKGYWKECLAGWTEHLEFISKSVPSVPYVVPSVPER